MYSELKEIESKIDENNLINRMKHFEEDTAADNSLNVINKESLGLKN